jgi:hypothetical protein
MKTLPASDGSLARRGNIRDSTRCVVRTAQVGEVPNAATRNEISTRRISPPPVTERRLPYDARSVYAEIHRASQRGEMFFQLIAQFFVDVRIGKEQARHDDSSRQFSHGGAVGTKAAGQISRCDNNTYVKSAAT